MEEIIKVEHVDLIYRSAQTLSVKKIINRLFGKGESYILSNYQALSDISFTLQKGKVYGIIGSNGAGKSTLLRILAGVMSPNAGVVERNYKTINLLALGVGFSKELTGIDNIFLNGMLLGFSKKQIELVKEQIIAYSEIGEFINRPIKTYSSGMVARLGFSIAMHLKPEVLLIDETLSVGDGSFRKKSFESIKQTIEDKDTTVVIVSHDIGTVNQLCDHIIWLEKGRKILEGTADQVIDLYMQYQSKQLTLEQVLKKNIKEVTGGIEIDATSYDVQLAVHDSKTFMGRIYDQIECIKTEQSHTQITKRTLKNGDIFLYIECQNQIERNIKIRLDQVMAQNNYDKYYEEPLIDQRYGQNKVTGPSAYLDLAVGSALITKVYYYKPKVKKYKENWKSYYLELMQERNDIVVGEQQVEISLKPYEGKSCFTLLLSKNKLFKDIRHLEQYMTYYFKSLYHSAVWCSFFMTPSGTYTKLPYSIDPFSKDGYGFNLQHSSRKDLFPFVVQTKERFFEDMLNNAILQAYIYQQRKDDVFYTPYTSKWLKKNTGITAPYIDTRLNESFIFMLQDFLPYSEFDSCINPLKGYLCFLMACSKEANRMFEVSGGVFFSDYFQEGKKRKSHASLNHQLGTAQLFYEAYKQYGEKQYLEMFLKMIKFIENTKKKWVKKENSDLYYGVKQAMTGGYQYFGDDYVYVTLSDLLNVQKDYIEIHEGTYCEALTYLIESKISYLNKTAYSLFSEEEICPPGEKIYTKSQVLKRYNELYVKRCV